MPRYTDDQLDDLEENAERATPKQQSIALAHVAGILERNVIPYGVMGGMNFYLRGSGRTTGDVDIAVDYPPRMDAILDCFDNDQSIYRPNNIMQWASGVARIFVRVGQQLVQLDLKPKGAEGHLIPNDIAGSTDKWRIPSSSGSFDCNLLAIGPLVAAKIKAHYGRETNADYRDLMFVCQSPTYAPLVRAAAPNFRQEWKDCFLQKVMEKNPTYTEQIRFALATSRTPSPPAVPAPAFVHGGNGRGGQGGNGRGGHGGNGRGGHGGNGRGGHGGNGRGGHGGSGH